MIAFILYRVRFLQLLLIRFLFWAVEVDAYGLYVSFLRRVIECFIDVCRRYLSTIANCHLSVLWAALPTSGQSCRITCDSGEEQRGEGKRKDETGQ